MSVALRNFVLFFGAAVMMAVTSPRLSFFVLGAIPLVVLPLVAFGRWVRRLSRSAQDTLADASAYASEMIGAVRVLQAFTSEAPVRARFAQDVERALSPRACRSRRAPVLTAVGIFLVFAGVVAIIWVGSRDVLAGAITPGTLGQFVLYAAFAAGALGELSQVWGEISQASGAAERLFEILNIRPQIAAPQNPQALPQPPRGDVVLRDVRFFYPTRPEHAALDGVSLSVKAGEKVAIVGPSGAGKSTLFHLLLRFYDPSAGRLRSTASIFGRPIRAPCANAWRWCRRMPSSLPRPCATTFALAGLMRPSEAVERAAEQAQADEFIRRLPQGYASMIGERGVTLSGGQRQRMAIARAILRDAPLLLLDEATSSLDAESETLVQTALEKLMQGRTTLVIAHRLATVLSCDRIVVMEQGRIVEEGTHAALVAAGGLYARLAKLQFEQA